MSSTLHLDEIPYQADCQALFACLRELPGAALLDSAGASSRGGRFDILVAEPVSGPPALETGASQATASSWFAELSHFQRTEYAGIRAADNDLPFCGGLLGYIGYEAGAALEAVSSERQGSAPAAHLRAYDYALIQDHLLRRAVMVSLPWVSPAARARRLRMLQKPSCKRGQRRDFRLRAPFQANLDKECYLQAFSRIQDYIQAGDCYQVNLARRFSSRFEGDPWQAYQWLREQARAPFSAYLDLEQHGALLCLSPERFMQVQGRHVETRPIKGTRPRLKDPEADRAMAETLRNSVKDRAENLMIVDLLRNDLGRSCIPGSIRVDNLFELESYATVHHLVSTISGELAPGRSAWELLRESFPGGSITGAPKRRSMQIIAELEPHARQTYCGSVLYVSADGRMDSNIAIRSLLCREGEILCWGGGGIVADSVGAQEYQETLDKIGPFLDTLEARALS